MVHSYLCCTGRCLTLHASLMRCQANCMLSITILKRQFCNLRNCPSRATLLRCVRLGSNLRYFASVAFTRPLRSVVIFARQSACCSRIGHTGYASVTVPVTYDSSRVPVREPIDHMVYWRWECNTTGCKCTHSNNPDQKLDHDLSGQILNMDWRARCLQNTRQGAVEFAQICLRAKA